MTKSPGFKYNFNHALSGDPENINPENSELMKAVPALFMAGQKLIVAGHETIRYTCSLLRHSAIEIHKF